MKRKPFIVLAMATVAITAVLFWNLRRSSPIIIGTLDREDSKQIIQITRRTMWTKAFPTFSWQTIKQAPRSLYLLQKTRLRHIEVMGYGEVQVRVSSPLATN